MATSASLLLGQRKDEAATGTWAIFELESHLPQLVAKCGRGAVKGQERKFAHPQKHRLSGFNS